MVRCELVVCRRRSSPLLLQLHVAVDHYSFWNIVTPPHAAARLLCLRDTPCSVKRMARASGPSMTSCTVTHRPGNCSSCAAVAGR